VDTVLDLAKVLIPAAATLVGLYFANAFKRRTRQEVLERRVDAYVAFWPVMNTAASTRLDGPWAGGPLTADERRAIFDAATDWYYGTAANPVGHGLFLSDRARRVYLAAKRNLACPADEIQPQDVRESVQRATDVERERGAMSIRQLSLLRWVMRFDLDLHTEPYFANVGENEIAFLEFCDIDVNRAPWNKWLKRKDEPSGNGGDAARL
jgi:hypothetical protein